MNNFCKLEIENPAQLWASGDICKSEEGKVDQTVENFEKHPSISGIKENVESDLKFS